MPSANQQALRHFLSLWARRDAAAMVECFAPEGVYDNVPDGRPYVGRTAIRAWLDMCFQHLTRIDVEVLTMVDDGDVVMCERIDDHVVGEKHMRLPVANMTRFANGRIVLLRDYYCRQTVKELGMG